jgi:hypothetical protein
MVVLLTDHLVALLIVMQVMVVLQYYTIGASGSNAGKGGIAIGAGSVADGTSGNANGNGQGRSVALDGGHTHQGCTDAIGKMCFNPP